MSKKHKNGHEKEAAPKKISRNKYEAELPQHQDAGEYSHPDFSTLNFGLAVYP